ncbi:GNAT family N-acetyltransferase [Allomesorhizobium camelthorni]|uniref:GNAT family N-acetyltransferase n=1 Tax=Allomesorhizobium camelthorni TaxID=475069 RepID=A0A6G4W5Y5_9HYPH|nr:GNAT family N-acetyltransferase [Mesorhizobium camelthorni]NGO49580.1 GNAT family N-acetyltransferase [Mesorhizobium camelthorni]
MTAITVRPLEQSDHADWRRLWTAYLEFYETTVPEEVYQTTWERLFAEGEFEPKGFLAFLDGKPVGLVHFLYHRSCWSLEGNCYLQDLFTDPDARGSGAGVALIEAVRAHAEARGVANVYWMTHETNATARKLYDRVARRTGFIEYDLLWRIDTEERE